MVYPDFVLAVKKKGTEVRFIKGKYYLYEVSSKYNPEKKRAQKITGKFLGSITEKGLIPPKVKAGSLGVGGITSETIAVKEYGASSFMLEISKDILLELSSIFDDKEAATILILSVLRAIHHAPFKKIERLYSQSYLSEIIPGLKLSGKDISVFMSNLGSQRDKIGSFMKRFLVGSQHMIFDATSIISNSKEMKINRMGYNAHMEFEPQVNLLYAFSYDKNMPVYYRIIPGHIREVTAFGGMIKEACLESVLIVADKGFASSSNIELLEAQDLDFILPLKRSSGYFDKAPIESGNKASYDGFFMFKKRPIWYYSREADDKKKVVVFIDNDLKTKEEKDYLTRIEDKIEGYNEEGFLKKQYDFGAIVVITNLKNKAPKEIYEVLKTRAEIETVFDTLKNTLQADSSYMQNETRLEAWAFINHIALMLIYKIYTTLREHDLISKYSPADLIEHLQYIFRLRINDSWVTSEISSKTKKLMGQIGVDIT